MSETILLGRGETIIGIDAKHWRAHLAQAQQHGSKRLKFMTEDHRRVRNFVVSELPHNEGMPLSAQEIATRLDLPLSGVITLLDDLQQRLFFRALQYLPVCLMILSRGERSATHIPCYGQAEVS